MTDSYNTIVIGGGQAGLATGYFLQKEGRDFIILDAGKRIGDVWRNRWDSLRLFTPARYSGLPGMPFPAPPHIFPTKDEMGDYLEAYAEYFELPVHLDVRVDHLTKEGERFLVNAGNRHFVAENVVVAMATHQIPTTPDFADELDPDIVQLHSSDYRNPSQLQDGGVLVVGAGNSGAEISLEAAHEHTTWLSGRDVGRIPFHIESVVGRHLGVPFVLRFLFHRVLTVDSPIGRKMRPKFISQGTILVRTKPADLAEAGIERVPRTVGVQDGLPTVGDDRVLEAANVIWATGYRSDFSWIDLPIFEGDEPVEPNHYRGIVADEPGVYFVGLLFLYAASSEILCGVGRDAKHVVEHIASRPPHGSRSSQIRT
ncbi:flavin-containing monooxygenase [Haladaptatus pallidirubidus]|uniref:NAD(P)/FAD-dependent oxidoreductase n=1 Tax=Haladaptatus pallidirubidus TaxID=1008152 RepID=A0AAV3UQT3_9EURY|nr:NAD(P)/FAD-dependent oxidoreductase [Haladaptatus pallidirubidus]